MKTPKPGTHWKCPKCGRKAITALPVKGILCRPCTNQIRQPETWMNPDNDPT